MNWQVKTVLGIVSVCAQLAGSSSRLVADEPLVLNVWPDRPPGEEVSLPPESDLTKPTDKLIAGRRIIKLGNVSIPQIAVYRPVQANGAAILICPGGGHHILAYDLEGVEVAQWLNSIGVTAIVLKYRVPAREREQRWRAAVQDAQRAMSLVRERAKEWNIDPRRLGICGFSAGGETAALTSVFLDQRRYKYVDAIDRNSCRPDFALLIYPAGIVVKGKTRLQEHVKVGKDTPPMFFAHAFDDRVSVHNSLVLAGALKEAGVPAELHVYAKGGHGYGLRQTEHPVTQWPQPAERWLRSMKFIPSPQTKLK